MPDSAEARRRRVQRNLATAARTINAVKLAAGCVDCGYRDHPAALHFDHVDPWTKHSEPGWQECRSKLSTQAKLIAYLDHVNSFCEVRCANCHAKRSAEERHWQPSRDPRSRDAEPDLFSA